MKNQPPSVTALASFPFREQDLLSTGLFIQFCRRHGAEINKYELRYLNDEGWIAPAINQADGAFYSKFQLYPLRLITTALSLTLLPSRVLNTTSDWEKLAATAGAHFKTKAADIRKQVAEFSPFFALYYDVEILAKEILSQLTKRWEENYHYALSEIDDNQEKATQRADSDLFFFRKKYFRAEFVSPAKDILTRHSFTIEKITSWRWRFLHEGFFQPTNKDREQLLYLTKLNEQDIISADPAYRIVYYLNLFLFLLDEPEVSVKALLLNTAGYEQCPNPDCQKLFESQGKRQVTCGAPACVLWNKRDKSKTANAKTRKLKE